VPSPALPPPYSAEGALWLTGRHPLDCNLYSLKALPTPRTRGAIPNWRSTPTLQYSITPRCRIRGRRRGQPARRSLWFV